MIPNTTPSTIASEAFETDTPSLADAAIIDDVLELGEDDAYAESQSLTSTDVKADPILSSLAKHQGALLSPDQPKVGTGGGFKARPAPASTRQEGLGPRMTKAVALRLGLKWEDPRSKRVQEGEKEKEGALSASPGHKRVGLNIPIASLASPSVTPRPTKSSLLRTGSSGEAAASPLKRDPAAIAAANKARAAEEKERRRKSIALPASLSAPLIAPRLNRSAQLRLGGPTAATMSPSSGPSRTLAATNAGNVGKAHEEPTPKNDKTAISASEKASRRASLAAPVRSLGAPLITPRLNKAALLRAPPPPSSICDTTNPSDAAAPPTPTKSATTPSRPGITRALSTRSGGTSGTPRSEPGPRPTKSSLLRAGLGAKVQAV